MSVYTGTIPEVHGAWVTVDARENEVYFETLENTTLSALENYIKQFRDAAEGKHPYNKYRALAIFDSDGRYFFKWDCEHGEYAV